MPRFLILAAGLAALAPAARADDPITPATVEAVKQATVFVRIEEDGKTASGSGFVVAADGQAVLVATNHHVIAPLSSRAAKPVTLIVVFDSGQKAERSYTATVAAADPDRDLAVLRVAGVTDTPRPVVYADPPTLVETLPVYTFGFPFGKALSATSGFPAVTVGKATISSLRTGPDGELSVVQIDGHLNPGNSGGPVVDAKGRLVGVAVATVRDGPGIGLLIPAAELVRTMRGRPGRVRVAPKPAPGGKTTVRVEVDLIDPANKLRAATAHYVIVPPKAKRLTFAALDQHPGSTALALKIEKGVAAGEFVAPAAGEVLVQVSVAAAATRARAFPLAPPKPADLAGPPPAGWKEYTPRDKTFVMWVPEKPARQSEKERNATAGGQRLRVNTLSGRTADGLDYQAESVLLPASFARFPRKELYDLFRGALVAEANGRGTESKEATAGDFPGAEYVIEGRAATTRVRMYVAGSRVFAVQVIGTADLVAGADAETILSAFRPTGTVSARRGPAGEPAAPRARPTGKDPTILGGAFDPIFKDVAPDGGLLVGFEIGLGKFFDWNIIQAARPIYRVGDKETFGEQRGTQLARVVTIKAKEGYAVGGVAVRHGLTFGGMSVTFMKVTNGKLDPTDSYESDWVGLEQEKPKTKLGGDGTPVVGIVGKSNAKDMTGMGLLFKGQEAFDPNAPKK